HALSSPSEAGLPWAFCAEPSLISPRPGSHGKRMDESASSSLAVAEDAQRRPKLAERLARELALAISRDVLPEGHALGSEAELARRLDASRWTVREALGILESEGLISVRRGRNGGIFVAAPSDATISTAIR